MITDEMVDIACRAEWDSVQRDNPSVMSWDEVTESVKTAWRASVRAGFEAVMPKLVVAAVHEVDSLVEFTLVVDVLRIEPGGVTLRCGSSSRILLQGDALILPVKMTVS